MAVYEEQEAQQRATVSPGGSSPDPYDSELSVFQPIRGGEIEVNSSALKSSTLLLDRSSSGSTPSPPFEAGPSQPRHLSGRPTPTGGTPTLAHQGGAQHRARSDEPPATMSQTPLRLTHTVEISGECGPLGIRVVPYCSSLSGRSLGLHVRSVEANSRSQKDGIFQEDECIVKVNDTELMDKSFAQSQEVFRQAMRSPKVRLEVVPALNREHYEKSLIGQLYTLERAEGMPKVVMPLPLKAEPFACPGEGQGSPETPRPASLSAPHPTSPTAPPKGKPRDSPLKSSAPLPLPPLGGVANKKGGRKLKVELRKGPEGLGFTVVTRDASVHGPGPILVKNVLPRGAAVKDGRLQPGDRILEVNGVDVSGRTQEQLVGMLRATRQGETVTLLVLRQEEVFLPRELRGEQVGALGSEVRREQLKFEVPLNDSGSAGLGISLKGNRSRETGADLGIFIKSIMHGGAAHKDGRLRVNDQLTAVNGEPLLGKSNHVAMETLRRSMSMEGNLRGVIQLVLVRVSCRAGPTAPRQAVDTALAQLSLTQPTMDNSLCERLRVPFSVTNGNREHDNVYEEEDDDKEDLPPIPPRLTDHLESGPQQPPLHQRAELEPGPRAGGPSPLRRSRRPRVQSSNGTDPGKPRDAPQTTGT